MIVICSYCRKQYGEKAPWEDDSVSHGMCDGCYTHYARQFEGFSFDYFDDGLVRIIVNGEPASREIEGMPHAV